MKEWQFLGLEKKKLSTTMGIKHRDDSGFGKFRALSKLGLGGKVRSSEMPYISYLRTLSTIHKT
jgi:hypothetical protein